MPRKSDWTSPVDTGKLTFSDVDESQRAAYDRPYRQMVVQFITNDDIADFERLIGVQLPPQTKSIWYPANGRAPLLDLDRPPREYLNDLDDSDRPWAHEWRQMPECVNSNIITGQAPLTVNFGDAESVEQFQRAIGQTFTEKTKSIWHPEQKRIKVVGRKRYLGAGIYPRYPIYIPSKGRAQYHLTMRSLDKINVPYRVVVEPQEYEQYAAHIKPEYLLVMDEEHSGQGLHVTRNWIWDHARSEGHERFWQLDDNIKGFYRYNRNEQTPVTDGTMFAATEDFTDRYDNLAQSGFQYFMFVPRKRKYPSFSLNVRIYSCTLNLTDMRGVDGEPMYYRGPYNDDTDLSIRAMKAGYCTALMNAFLADKMATMQMSGGNTDDYYLIEEGRLKMAQALVDWHPDLATIQWRWGRFQHLVDYRPLRQNKLRLKEGLEIPPGVDNYGMRLQELIDGSWTDVPENPAYDREEIQSDYQEEMF